MTGNTGPAGRLVGDPAQHRIGDSGLVKPSNCPSRHIFSMRKSNGWASCGSIRSSESRHVRGIAAAVEPARPPPMIPDVRLPHGAIQA